VTGEEAGLEARRGLQGTAPHAVQADDDMTRIGSTGIPRPSAVASCPLRVEETGSNVVHKYSATFSNAGRDGAEVSSGHSSEPEPHKGKGHEGPNT
jgi:hypothetical protein